MEFEELRFLQDGDLDWAANGYRVSLPPDISPLSRQALTHSNPGIIFIAVLERAKQGDFEKLPLIVNCLRRTENAVLWGAGTELLGDAGSPRTIEQVLEQFRGALFEERQWHISLGMCGMMHQSLLLWTVPIMLALYLESCERRQLKWVEFAVARMLEEETEWGKGVLHRTTGEEFIRTAVEKYHSLRQRLGTDDTGVLHGRPFSVRQLAQLMHAQAAEGNPSGVLMRNERHGFEASTGRDCRSFFKNERPRALAIAAQMELFLGSSEADRFEPGRRYFYGHPLPAEGHHGATGAIRNLALERLLRHPVLVGAASGKAAEDEHQSEQDAAEEEAAPGWDWFVYDSVATCPRQNPESWSPVLSAFERAQRGDFTAIDAAGLAGVEAQEGSTLWWVCASLLGDAGPSGVIREIVERLRPRLLDQREASVQEFVCYALHQSRMLWAIPIMLEILRCASSQEQALSIGRLLSGLLEQGPSGWMVLGAGKPDDAYIGRVMTRYRELRDLLGTDEVAVVYGRPFSVKQVALLLQDHLKASTPAQLQISRERHLIQVSTGIDLSGFYSSGELRPKAALALIGALLNGKDLEPYQNGVRYFYGHPVVG
ncbi:hypothetical protein [Cystobacter fuscus]|uniref:hypothetical protein n=1 Tax=Cystobacter fuscus TaxID=43 RepID=UPI002B3108F7|nr:hypothetical protein F0U63_08505 [Cystobacter fuscus]